MNQLDKAVAATISELERQNQPLVVESGPKWVSDAEREGLPLTNVHDTRGAPVLDRDEVLRRSYPNYVRVK